MKAAKSRFQCQKEKESLRERENNGEKWKFHEEAEKENMIRWKEDERMMDRKCECSVEKYTDIERQRKCSMDGKKWGW